MGLANPSRTKAIGDIVCKHCRETPEQVRMDDRVHVRKIQVIRDFPNTKNHRTTITTPDSAEVWVSKDESPQLYMSVDTQSIWFKWLGSGAWELMEEAPECTRAVYEAPAREFIKGIYYDSDGKYLYSRDDEGNWKIFGSEDKPREWTAIQANDGAFRVLNNLSQIG